jgi:hypothetical protein
MANIKGAKAKGRLGQQAIRDMLYEVFPELEPGDIKSTTMGDNGADIQLSPRAYKLAPLDIEVKRRKSGMATSYTWLEQASTHGAGTPVVFFRADNKKWITIIPTDHYMELLKNWKRNEKDVDKT